MILVNSPNPPPPCALPYPLGKFEESGRRSEHGDLERGSSDVLVAIRVLTVKRENLDLNKIGCIYCISIKYIHAKTFRGCACFLTENCYFRFVTKTQK